MIIVNTEETVSRMPFKVDEEVLWLMNLIPFL